MLLKRFLFLRLRPSIFNFGFAVLFALTSCVSAPKLNQVKTTRSALEQQTSPITYKTKIVNSQIIRSKINQFKKSLERKVLNDSDWKLHDELLDAYIELKNRNLSKVSIPARSRITIPFETYCLNSNKAAPSRKEIYHWQKNDPGIKYYSELLRLRRQKQISQDELQTLLWNLQNETRWDDYPGRLKAVLQKVDPQAALKLPSQIKDTATNLIADAVLGIPGASEALDTYNLAKGKYYEYDDFKNSILAISSKHHLNDYENLTQIPETNLYTQSSSDSYSNQDVTFYNPTDQPQTIDLSEYYLAPERTDVQRIGINPQQTADPAILSDLEKVLYESMARLGIGFTPLVNDVADLYELLTGKDFVSGDSLSALDRALSGVGVVIGSGAGYRYAKRAINSPVEYVDEFSRGLGTAAGRPVDLNTVALQTSEKLLVDATQKSEPLKRNLSSLKDSLVLLKENGASRSNRRRIIEAFTPNTTVKTLTEDAKVYRYYKVGETGERGRWVTKQKVPNPSSELALPKDGPYEIKEWTIPKGQKVIEGLASPQFGKPGGGHQIYVPNSEVLK